MSALISISQFREVASGKWNDGAVVLKGNSLDRINNHHWDIRLNNVKSNPLDNHAVRQAFYVSVRDFLQGRLGVGTTEDAHNTYLSDLHGRLFADDASTAFLTRKEINSILNDVDSRFAFKKLENADIRNANDNLGMDGRQSGKYKLNNVSWKYSQETGLSCKAIRRICANEGDALRFLVNELYAKLPSETYDNDIGKIRHAAEALALKQLAGKSSLGAANLPEGAPKTAFDMLSGGFPLDLVKSNPQVVKELLLGFVEIAANREEDLAAMDAPGNNAQGTNVQRREWKTIFLRNELRGMSLTKQKDGMLSLSYCAHGSVEERSVTLMFPADHYAHELERMLVSMSKETLSENPQLKELRDVLVANLDSRWTGKMDGDHVEQLKHLRNLATIVLVNELDVERTDCEQIPIKDLLELASSLVRGKLLVDFDKLPIIPNEENVQQEEVDEDPNADILDFDSNDRLDGEVKPQGNRGIDFNAIPRATKELVLKSRVTTISGSVEFEEVQACLKEQLDKLTTKPDKVAVEYLSELAFAATGDDAGQEIIERLEKDIAKFSTIVNSCKDGEVLGKLTPLAKKFFEPLTKCESLVTNDNKLTESAKTAILDFVTKLANDVNRSVTDLSKGFSELYTSQNCFVNDNLPPEKYEDFLDWGKKLVKLDCMDIVGSDVKAALKDDQEYFDESITQICQNSFRNEKLNEYRNKYKSILAEVNSKISSVHENQSKTRITVEKFMEGKRKELSKGSSEDKQRLSVYEDAFDLYKRNNWSPKALTFNETKFLTWYGRTRPENAPDYSDSAKTAIHYEGNWTETPECIKYVEENKDKEKAKEEIRLKVSYSKLDNLKGVFRDASGCRKNLLVSVLSPELYEKGGKTLVGSDVFDLLAATITSSEKMHACFSGKQPSTEGAYEIVNTMLKQLFESSASGKEVTADDFQHTVESLVEFLSKPPAGLKPDVVRAHLPFDTIKTNLQNGELFACPVFNDLLSKLPGASVSAVLKGLCRQVIFRNLELNGQKDKDVQSLEDFNKKFLDPIYEQMHTWRENLGGATLLEDSPQTLKTYIASQGKGGVAFDFKGLDGERFDELQRIYDSNSTSRADFVEKTLPQYLLQVLKDPVQKGRLMKQLIRGGAEIPKAGSDKFTWKFFGEVAQGLGPIMQKFLQGYKLPMNASNDERDVFNKLKKNLTMPSMMEVDTQLELIKKSSGGRIADIKFEKFLGCATVGATALCTVTTVDNITEKCVIKLLHADVKKGRANEQKVIDEALAAVAESMKNEIDQAIARANDGNAADNLRLDKDIKEHKTVVDTYQKSFAAFFPDDVAILGKMFERNEGESDQDFKTRFSVANYLPKTKWTDEEGMGLEELNALLDKLDTLKAPLEKLKTTDKFRAGLIGDELSQFKDEVSRIKGFIEEKNRLNKAHEEHLAALNNLKQTGIDKEIGDLKAENKKRFDSIEQELDFKNELDSITKGLEVYSNKSDSVKSVNALSYIVPDSSFLTLRLVDGTTITDDVAEVGKTTMMFDKLNRKSIASLDAKREPTSVTGQDAGNLVSWTEYLLKIMEERQKLLESRERLVSTANVWFDEALGEKGTGFFHADLHAGNIMIEGNHATMIDFGNCGQFTAREKKLVHNLFVSVAKGGAGVDDFMEAITKLGFKNRNLLGTHRADLARILGEGGANASPEVVFGRFSKALEFLRNKGIVPEDEKSSVSNFLQSQVRLANSIREVNDSLRNLDKSVLSAGDVTKWNLDIWPLTSEENKANFLAMTNHLDNLGKKVFKDNQFDAQHNEFKGLVAKIKKLASNPAAIKPVSYESIVGTMVKDWDKLDVEDPINVNLNGVDNNDVGNGDVNNGVDNNIINV